MSYKALSMAAVCGLLTACSSGAGTAAGIINSVSSENPYWNWTASQQAAATDCNGDGQLTLDEINRSWSASDDDYAAQHRPFTQAEYDRATSELRQAMGNSTHPLPPTALMDRLTSYPRNYRFIGPCR